MSKITALKAAQAALKEHYRSNPEVALQTLSAEGRVDLPTIRAVVRNSVDLDRYEPRDAARWRARLASSPLVASRGR